MPGGSHPGRPGGAGDRGHKPVLHGLHGFGRHRGEIGAIGPWLLKVNLLQAEQVWIKVAHAFPQPLRVHSVADGAAVQDVEGRHVHHWAPGTSSRAATDWPPPVSNTSTTTSWSR